MMYVLQNKNATKLGKIGQKKKRLTLNNICKNATIRARKSSNKFVNCGRECLSEMAFANVFREWLPLVLA